MNIYIITENWQYLDKRVTRVVNDYANSISMKYELKVYHVTKVYPHLIKIFRRFFYLPLSLYNGMLPIDIYKNTSFTTDKFFFAKTCRNNFTLKDIGFSIEDKIIIHWLDTALYLLSKIELDLLKKMDLTVVVHELHPLKWLSVESNIKILKNVRVLSRNKKISSYLKDCGIHSKVLRSYI